MPIYDYACRCGESFAESRTIATRDTPAACPSCGKVARREMTAPNLGLLAPHVRDAHHRNEKSRHEPGFVQRHRCGSSCGCGTTNSKSSTRTRQVKLPKLGTFQSGRKSQRPWLLGH